ncbi:hypothetical protein J2751_000454 [Halorubrum alkaliphilum]|uniref:Uncharacterized protein n=1 Tax=Halorubrum alkaliphilum TaxID=261290 RepID=A0A8T4GED7_9EURY|nr:hypothetical protein [Halorubrum alkaliphilum]MBP1921465.1 hypothetical protein [Halorubrum alkaliphilum]
MPEQPSREEPSVAADHGSRTVDESVEPAVDESPVDETLKRRLREAYLNDEEDELVVTAVRIEGDEAVVETRLPHGEATHTERFDAPKSGSLEECAEFLRFLDFAGVSPLDLDELVGARLPATYDPETGWRVAGEFRDGNVNATERTGIAAAASRSVEWMRTYRDWLIVLLLVGGELLFVVVLIVVFG